MSLLAADQEPLARHFANRGRDLLTQFDHVPHRRPTSAARRCSTARWPGWSAPPTPNTTAATTRSWSAEVVRASGWAADDEQAPPLP